jgi:TET-associated glycosyltransferase-like protein
VIVAIPSKGRPTRVKSQKIIPSARVYVPALEADAYRRCGVENVFPVPDRVRGITATRNWILDSTRDPRVVFIDDDVKACGWFELLDQRGKLRRLNEAEWLGEFTKLFDLTEQLHYRLWGLQTDGALRAVYPFKPFLFRSYVTGSCMGVVNSSGIRFDESFPVKEDYELCLRCIREDGGILAARYIFWSTNHWTDKGGCRDYRTQSMEMEAVDQLMERYPGFIRRVTRGGSEYSIDLDF